MNRPPRSLEARAIGLLARREYSRAELRARLAEHAPDAQALEATLDHLASKKLLSDERFVGSLVRRRAERFGFARIRHELQAHRLSPEQLEPALSALKSTEFDRALQVWRKRFGQAPATREDRARQMRFLAGRGFAADVIHRVIGRAHASSGDPADPDVF